MYGINNNTGSTFSEHYNVFKNKSIRNRITSAMKVSDEDNKTVSGDKETEQSLLNTIGKGRRLHNQLRSDSGAERAQAISEIAMMIFGS